MFRIKRLHKQKFFQMISKIENLFLLHWKFTFDKVKEFIEINLVKL